MQDAQQTILDHYQHPSHKGELAEFTHHAKVENPLCGDQVEVFLRVSVDGIVEEVGFVGRGCVISQATTDMLLADVLYKPLHEVHQRNLESQLALLDVPIGVTRQRCVLLSLRAVQSATPPDIGE
ncbi:MAG TPA: iron-sulfur cluster assembly scaffold protein [Anaerolineales bacterium]|nr:iron-sulfur cluster assembly scaffold protein [Anaerolineales bacterium]